MRAGTWGGSGLASSHGDQVRLGVGSGNLVICSRAGGEGPERNSRHGVLPRLRVPLEALLWILEGFLPSWQLIIIKRNILNIHIY